MTFKIPVVFANTPPEFEKLKQAGRLVSGADANAAETEQAQTPRPTTQNPKPKPV